MKKLLLFSLPLWLLPLSGLMAQSGTLYDDSRLCSVHISIHPDSLQLIYDSVLSDHYYQARFVFDDGAQKDTLENVGFRLRGNTSRYSKKKSFKISFNTYVSDRKYQGVKKLNLNGQHNDPTMMREKIFYDLWKIAGMPERRTSFVKLYIHGNYYGLYNNPAEMHKDWLGRVFPDKKGNLYKCTYPADLVYLGMNQNTYKNLENSTASGGRVYELQTNEEEDDYTRLVELIARLDKVPDTSFLTHTGEFLHLDQYLKALALDVATGNWDSYSFNKNNYYLYDNPATGKFEFISYDTDNTFGIDWFGIDWGSRDCRNWINMGIKLPMAQKLMNISFTFNRYKAFLDTITRTVTHPDSVFPRIDRYKILIQEAAEADSFRTLDYGYTIADFNNSFNQKVSDHTPYGLKPFLTRRHTMTLQQLQPFGVVSSAESARWRIFPNPVGETLNISTTEQIHDEPVVVVMDIQGRMLFRLKIPSAGLVKIPAGGLSPGMYLLIIKSGTGERFQRLFLKDRTVN